MKDEKDKSRRVKALCGRGKTTQCSVESITFREGKKANEVGLWEGWRPAARDEDRAADKSKIIHGLGGKSGTSLFTASVIGSQHRVSSRAVT